MEDIKGLRTLIENSVNIVIVGHHNPDGDSVGSATAAARAIRHNFGKRSAIIFPSAFPGFLSFLAEGTAGEGAGTVMVWGDGHDNEIAGVIGAADLILCIDFNTLKRTESLEPLIRGSAAHKVMIDHHLNPDSALFDFVFSRTEVSSACEVLFDTLRGMGCEIDLPTATSLYTGMMTDTNNYANSLYPSTLRMSAFLIEAGVDKESIQMAVLSSHTEQRMRLMGYVLSEKMVVLPELRAAYITLSDGEKERFAFRKGDSEGFVNLPLNIADVDISAFFSQENGLTKVSLRSKGEVSVNDLANRFFNGGGHRNAAGGRISVPLAGIPEYFEKSLKSFLSDNKKELC